MDSYVRNTAGGAVAFESIKSEAFMDISLSIKEFGQARTPKPLPLLTKPLPLLTKPLPLLTKPLPLLTKPLPLLTKPLPLLTKPLLEQPLFPYCGSLCIWRSSSLFFHYPYQ